MRAIILIIALYNLIFIPICFGFRVKFEGVYMLMEILTILFYLIDICLRWSTLNTLSML